ncbi:TonB-dependent hemoglobin/transferrin/lactoferrin family receptor [Bradyrhizobium sp. U87765 SZCCT0131]|uniref:TonB-dependent hemoglobin/transferrin/lactoferrin family receptor n=1 Tax=unclassified Bradyrhizobium TaxID=2631580 RepID=UPI001BAC9352|nr:MULTISPECIES: TonB-dependent hemoglobin/transferrin/lactoferrin family receptor [unclassified Bradyrhizobium]MBR1222308.1 TonB-dependent hemoglobin/transferrin/lactoferrin family receptor [Bradyrhizobium sp. U87765 SZCCT0131]MBR1264208.1 TonB-dependent hemoglobin/transferrin/lactoferrin family receptor [Bradyrhizobium sp. U87765 SZCCT0134]MBR1308009.1 TonB-dependent hemoglobin/transferrin/lactoferrin family receptor [Bradyrhizobium sp. U87765 SZCCT0110]MBR1320458.1 TonB-dependent hemoglobin/
MTKKTDAGAAHHWLRVGLLGSVWTILAAGVAWGQAATAQERERAQAGARVAASYGVMLETISVYADRNPRQLLDLPQNVTVIGRKELDERQVRDVQDLVRYEPGITVGKTTSGTDPFGNLAGFTIRGVSNNRVQMLVDGTRVIESITDGNRDFVNMANLKAVEIVRGPAGVMWGADALGGVVAFVTKDPEDYLKGRNFGGQLDVGFDSYDKSFFKTGTSAFRFGDFSAMLSASQRSYSEGTLSKARADGGIYGCPRPAEAIRCNQLNPLSGSDYDVLGKLVWAPDKEHEVKFAVEYLNKDATVDQRFDLGLQSTGIRNLGYVREQVQSRERFTLSHRYAPELGWLDQVRWQVSHSPQERNFTGVRDRRLANGQYDRLDFLLNYKETFSEGDIQFNSSFNTPFAQHKLTYGAYASVVDTDYNRRDVTTNLTTRRITIANAGGFNFADATTRRVDGFIQDEISLFDRRLILTPGLRYATYDLDPRPNPYYVALPGKEPRQIQSEKLIKQLGAVVKLDSQLSLVGRYAEGFKMPTAQQLFTSLPNGGGSNSDLIPNPALRPEQVKSYEIGLRGEFSRGFASATLFKADYTDFIQSFVEIPSVTNPGNVDYTYQNLSSVNVWGVELAGEYRFDDVWSVSASLAYIEGKQRYDAASARTPFDGTTPLSGTIGLRYFDRARGFDAQLISTFADRTPPRSASTLYRADGYVVFDAIVNWAPQWVPGLTLRGAVLNIADVRYFPSFNGTTTYAIVPTTAVAMSNPLELRTAPGRTFKVGASYAF